MTQALAALRQNRPSDVPFIMRTWYRTMREQGPRWLSERPRHGNVPSSYMPPCFFDKVVVPRLRRILYDCGAVIACSPSDDDLVYGFRVGDEHVTHLTYVKSHYRRMGIARQLCSGLEADSTYTLSTPTERRMRRKFPRTWRYKPNGMWQPAAPACETDLDD